MEPEKPDKPELKSGAGVTVVDEAPPSFKENVKEELDLLKKKATKESILQEFDILFYIFLKARPGLIDYGHTRAALQFRLIRLFGFHLLSS